MRVTKRTNIAMRVLMFCAAHSDRLVTKSEIARTCNASENHLAQIINQLAQLGFIRTHRGRNGGLQLARPATDINVGQLFRALETPGNIEGHDEDYEADSEQEVFLLRDILSDAADAFYKTLDPVSLDSLLCSSEALQDILDAPLRNGVDFEERLA